MVTFCVQPSALDFSISHFDRFDETPDKQQTMQMPGSNWSPSASTSAERKPKVINVFPLRGMWVSRGGGRGERERTAIFFAEILKMRGRQISELRNAESRNVFFNNKKKKMVNGEWGGGGKEKKENAQRRSACR